MKDTSAILSARRGAFMKGLHGYCAVTPYGSSADCSRVRVFECLHKAGADFAISIYVSRIREFAARRWQGLILKCEASPLSRGESERRLVLSSDFSVHDFDDARQWDYGAGGLLRRPGPKADKVRSTGDSADRIIAGKAVVANPASRHHRDVVVIPSCGAPEAYARKTAYTLHDPPRPGWVGTPGNGGLEKVIDRVVRSPASERSALSELDIGIMPVPGTPYGRGRCGYKLLQDRALLGRRARETVCRRYSYDAWSPP
jgi:hypothetical protein